MSVEKDEDEPESTKETGLDEDGLDDKLDDEGDEFVNGEAASDEKSPDGIAEKLVNDKDYAWKLYLSARKFIYEVAYDFVVERPNDVSKLEKHRSQLIRKRNKNEKEQLALENLDKFITECSTLRKDYFSRIVDIHELQEDLGKDILNIELRRLHKKGLLSKWVVYGMVFGLPTAENIKNRLSLKREVRANKPRSNA